MKKLICLVTSITIVLGYSGISAVKAANIKDVNSNTITLTLPKTITLEESLNNIEKVNPEIQILDKKIEILNEQYEYDKYKSNLPDARTHTLDYDLQKNYNFKESLNNLNSAKSDKVEELKTIKNDLKKQYLNALCAKEDMDIINKSIENLDNKIKIQNSRINAGIATENSLENLKVEKSNFQSSLNQLNLQLQSELLTIKQYLNINMSQEIKLSDTKEDYIKFDDNNIDARIKTAVEKNAEIIKQENNLNLLRDKTNIYTNYYSGYENQIRTFQINIGQAHTSINNLTLTTKINLWQSYYNLKNAEDTVNQEKINLENADDDINTAKAKYEIGTMNKSDVDDTYVSLEQQKSKLKRAINNYMIVSESFENSLK
ncbi:TolC family protein [Clostridium tyrobutyricum]|uniref:TolC family protein n=1 Tax=Clostridium tyrobutyricum TaxID=1519 RepID=UPI001C3CA3BB|nr:TolC family protein [Clostridium tyrobutyricum]MBV4438459.1 TolC family protein [Clostridium tyrobutyricum]